MQTKIIDKDIMNTFFMKARFSNASVSEDQRGSEKWDARLIKYTILDKQITEGTRNPEME